MGKNKDVKKLTIEELKDINIGFSEEEIKRMTSKCKFNVSDFDIFEDPNMLNDE